MARNFNILDPKFYNEYINGSSFTDNLGQFSSRLTGNAGELVKVIRQVSVSITVNPNCVSTIEFITGTDPTFGIMRSESLNFQNEGLWNGAVVDVFFDNGQSVLNVVIGTISGRNYGDLNITKAALISAGLQDGKTKLIKIKLKDAPRYLNFKYGLLPMDSNGPNYKSPYDNNEQSYYAYNITNTPTLTRMIWKGNEIGADLGFVDVTYDGAPATYEHFYTVEHTFRIPFYIDGEFANIQGAKNPQTLSRPVNVKYASGFFFGSDTNEKAAVFEDVGGTNPGRGNVGYFGENFDGQKLEYNVRNALISNSLGTGVIEATVTNTVTFNIGSLTAFGLKPGDKVILYYSKLPTENEYSNQKTSWNDIWMFDSLVQIADDPAVSSVIISNYTVIFNGGSGEFDVSFDVDIPVADRDKINGNQTNYSIWITIATQRLGNSDTMDRSSVGVHTAQNSKDETVGGLITAWQPEIFEHWNYNTGIKKFTNFDGWDGDLLGQEMNFETDLSQVPIIKKFIFRVVADNGTDNFILFSKQIQIPSIQTQDVGGTQYQIVDVSEINDFQFSSNDILNSVRLFSVVPTVPAATQSWVALIGFQVPWQEWIEKLTVPTSFYDILEPNGNRNQRSSNYSGASGMGYDIRTVVALSIGSDTGPDSEYELLSDSSNILQLNDNGGSSFSKVYELLDASGNPTLDLAKDQNVTVKIHHDHTLGVIPLANISGLVWMLPKNGTGQPFFLSTDKDLTNSQSTLQPSDTLLSGNIQFVEVISINNRFTFIVKTRSSKMTDGVTYGIYTKSINKL
jgi:hypothetical protein